MRAEKSAFNTERKKMSNSTEEHLSKVISGIEQAITELSQTLVTALYARQAHMDCIQNPELQRNAPGKKRKPRRK